MFDIQTAITRKYYPKLKEELELKEFNLILVKILRQVEQKKLMQMIRKQKMKIELSL